MIPGMYCVGQACGRGRGHSRRGPAGRLPTPHAQTTVDTPYLVEGNLVRRGDCGVNPEHPAMTWGVYLRLKRGAGTRRAPPLRRCRQCGTAERGTAMRRNPEPGNLSCRRQGMVRAGTRNGCASGSAAVAQKAIMRRLFVCIPPQSASRPRVIADTPHCPRPTPVRPSPLGVHEALSSLWTSPC